MPRSTTSEPRAASAGSGGTYGAGVSLYNAQATNPGLILASGAHGYGVSIYSGGTLANYATIEASGGQGRGVQVQNGGTILNGTAGNPTALIAGGTAGIYLGNDYTPSPAYSAVVTNFGTVSGGIGVLVSSYDTVGNTIVNYGTIIGTGGVAIDLGTTGNELLVVKSGSVLQGVVGDVQVGDRFDLPFMAFSNTGTTTVVSNGTVSQTLDIVENGSTVTVALDPSQSFAGDIFQLGTDAGGGTLVTDRRPAIAAAR